MKVYNLRCQLDHQFEGWFSSELDYEKQLQAGQLQCPLCGASDVVRLPSAPRLNLLSSRGASDPCEAVTKPTGGAAIQATPATHVTQMAQAAHLLALAQTLANQSEDVGERFADEARRIHYGEAEQRSIRGSATIEEGLALIDEGIAVLPLPGEVPSKDRLH